MQEPVSRPRVPTSGVAVFDVYIVFVVAVQESVSRPRVPNGGVVANIWIK